MVNNLKLARAEKAISQSKLAQDIGVSRSTIAMWETDGSQPDNASLLALSDYFGVSTDFLLGNETQKKPTTDKSDELDINTLEYALYGEARELDEDEKQQLLELAKLMRKKRDGSAN